MFPQPKIARILVAISSGCMNAFKGGDALRNVTRTLVMLLLCRIPGPSEQLQQETEVCSSLFPSSSSPA